MKKKRKKSTFTRVMEYIAVYLLVLVSRVLPLHAVRIISNLLGDTLYLFVKRRRTIALENLRHAFPSGKDEKEIRKIARGSCRSFFLTFLETIKLRVRLSRPSAMDNLRETNRELDEIFHKAKKIHDGSGGCIFVTPHIGNWEILPYVSSAVGISLAVVVRPLDNVFLERLIYENRAASGQVIIPKKNAMFVLRETLRQGKSIGMLPDQSTMRGISVNFFGRMATTTPVPAILSIMYKRPIVVVACCRKPGDYQYDGFVSDPIMPCEYISEKAEIFRLSEEMNRTMESIVRRYPEQYLWIHNRWKTYKDKKEVLS